MTFMLAVVLAVLLEARIASRKLIRPSAPWLAVRAVMLLVLPSTTSLIVETVIVPAAYACGVEAETNASSRASTTANERARRAAGAKGWRAIWLAAPAPIDTRL